MSGGHFNYEQYKIEQIADEVEQLIIDNASSDYPFSNATIDEFKVGLELLRKAQIYTQRIDWLVSADDGEDTFHERLKNDLSKL